jgi:hypothetical protein
METQFTLNILCLKPSPSRGSKIMMHEVEQSE